MAATGPPPPGPIQYGIVNRTDIALVVLAAGLGSRFGGLKQLAPVGPKGEAILDYNILDANRAGIDRVVMIVRSEILERMRDHLTRFHPGADVTYVLQDDSDAPKRDKPWGTAHALLCASPHLPGRFLVVNADDRYGPNAIEAAVAALEAGGDHVLVGYPIAATLPEHGSVSRARCQADEHGHLEFLEECHGVHRGEHGLRADGGPLPEGTLVSMNLWGFQASLTAHLRPHWQRFLAAHAGDAKSEFLLPTLVADLMRSGDARVRLVRTGDAWVGLTNPDDLPVVQAQVREFVAAGVYPPVLPGVLERVNTER